MNHKLAAVDLGSNTFRLAIGHISKIHGITDIQVDDQTRELISLANGLDSNNILSQTAIDNAIASLKRFGLKLNGFTPADVRIVATNTFRVARNIDQLLPQAEAAIGFPVEIISGTEEARLIYLGVVHGLSPAPINRFVMDIGGGSTEFIIGKEQNPIKLASLSMGCTTWTKQFFPDGQITAKRMAAAIKAGRKLLQNIATDYINCGWQQAYGSSGTVKGVLAILEENGFSEDGITLVAMQKFKHELIKIGQVNLEDWAGLKSERAPLLAGGLAILIASFEELNIGTMYAGDGALRIGVLHDMVSNQSQA